MTIERLIEKMAELRREVNPKGLVIAPRTRLILYGDGSGKFELIVWGDNDERLDESFHITEHDPSSLETAFATFAANVRLHLEGKA